MNLLDGWHRQVRIRTACPWPGPRPMRAGRDHRNALVGRGEDSKDFARLVYDTDVVVFTGVSGVGKSSMLQLDLRPTLEEAGYTVLYCNDWNRSSEAIDVDELLLRQVEDQLSARTRIRMRGGASLLGSLDELYPDRSVVLLDQFEELIRYQPREYQRVLRWIEAAASDTRVRIVISLRVEYEHELRSHFGLKLGPFQQARYELRPIEDRAIVRSIIAGADQGATFVIDEDATETLLDAWENAAGDDGVVDRGLLHLQALLYVLWATKQGSTITSADIAALRRMLETKSPPDGRGRLALNSGLFARALALAVQVELSECSAACEPSADGSWPGVDPVLASRARDIVRAMSGHLSSGGYKVSLAREELARSVLFQEGGSALARYADRIEGSRHRLAELVDSSSVAQGANAAAAGTGGLGTIDWLSVSRSELSGEPAPDGMPWELDPTDLTGGVMLGMRPEDSLIEEFRSFYFALEWLRACELVRLTTPYRGKTMVTLIHDLFGHGLVDWSRSAARGGAGAFSQFTAVRGVEMTWRDSMIRQPVIANVRLRSCDIETDLSDVTFVNCDFRGTTFVRCRFDGVSFVNCMLDDAEFLECSIVGAATPLPVQSGPEAGAKPRPSFFLPHTPRALLDSLLWYREPRRATATVDDGLYSRTAGMAAVPAERSGVPDAMVFGPQPGGLSLFGGRVSSLKVRDCDFGEKGRLTLRYVAGTSVEFADQTHARIDIHGAAIRGLTLTRPIDADTPDPRGFDITFGDSRIINMWFGVGLAGAATFVDCLIWQLFNAADRTDFTVIRRNSPSYGAVNVEPIDQVWQMDLAADSLGSCRDEVRDASRTIDYRKRPVRFELLDRPLDPG